MVAYVACEPYFDIATGKLANDVTMDVNDNNASTNVRFLGKPPTRRPFCIELKILSAEVTAAPIPFCYSEHLYLPDLSG